MTKKANFCVLISVDWQRDEEGMRFTRIINFYVEIRLSFIKRKWFRIFLFAKLIIFKCIYSFESRPMNINLFWIFHDVCSFSFITYTSAIHRIFSAWFIFLCSQVRSSAWCLRVGCSGQWFGRLLSLLTFCRSNQHNRDDRITTVEQSIFIRFKKNTLFSSSFIRLPSKQTFFVLLATRSRKNERKIQFQVGEKYRLIHREKPTKACQELKQFINGIANASLIQLKPNIASIAFTI